MGAGWKMNKRIAAGLLAPALCLAGCRGGGRDVWAAAGQTVSTALFDFTIDGVQAVDAYAGLTPEADGLLVRMDLTVTNTTDEALTMFAQDFQIQWGEGAEDFGCCLEAADETMVPYSYRVEPGGSHTGVMVVQVPAGTDGLIVAYQEMLASGEPGTAYFVEAAL